MLPFVSSAHAFSYLAHSFTVPGQDGLEIDKLARHAQLFLRHVGHFPHDMNLKREEKQQINHVKKCKTKK